MVRLSKQPLRGSVTQNFSADYRRERMSPEAVLLFRILIIGTVLLIVSGLCYWAWRSRLPQNLWQQLQTASLETTRSARFDVRDIVVVGRRHTDKDELLVSLDVLAGSPMLSFDPKAALERVEKLPWVAHATILRRLPDTIYVELHEREPTARWQHSGKTVIIDREGKELPQVRFENFSALPLVIGEDAPRETEALLDALKPYPSLAPLIMSSVRVSERRWNLYLKPKLLVKLPEKGIEGALQRLSQLVLEQKILERDVVAVDLRLPDRLYLETGAKPQTKE